MFGSVPDGQSDGLDEGCVPQNVLPAAPDAVHVALLHGTTVALLPL